MDASSPSSLADSAEPWTAQRLHQASYKDLGSPVEVEARFYRHLLRSDGCRQALEHLLQQSSTTTRDYSITIDAFDLINADPILGHLLLRYPGTLLPLLESAAVSAQHEMLRVRDDDDNHDHALTVKGAKSDGVGATRLHARLVNLPPYGCQQTRTFSAQDVGRIVQVTGTVVRTSAVQMYESARTYQCKGQKGCDQTFVVHADLEQRNNALVAPERCILSRGGERCKGTNLQVVEGGSVHTDYQEIKIQESASSLAIGHIPRSLLIKLQHDLVDTAQPGDEIVVVGSLLAQWQQPSVLPDVECQVGMAMSAHSVRVVAENGSSAWKNASNNSLSELDKYRKEFEAYWAAEKHQLHPMVARDFICKAVCPKLYGLQVIKLALLLTLIGGVSSDAYGDDKPDAVAEVQVQDDEPDQFTVAGVEPASESLNYYGEPSRPAAQQRQQRRQHESVKTRRRDQSHILLVGDPGTGKSQVLRFAAALCPRSVLTTGVGTTSAGLTCAAVREGSGKEFALEAGALVLADKGVCCIDEFGCIREQDRTTIHEAMEQQTLSVAKAGIVCKLNCRATIVAVMNPRDCLYDNYASLSVNTGLGTPLLSRFDLIFKLVDVTDVERDCKMTTYLLNRAIQGLGFDVDRSDCDAADEEPWTMEKLRAYISIVKERFQPTMSDEAAVLLERHYEKCRAARSNTIPVTVRFLESLIRLSQSHARLMFRNVVTLDDAVAIIRVMECTAFAYGGFDGGVDDVENVLYCDPMTTDFSPEADSDFLCFMYRILDRYGLLHFLPDDRRQKAKQAFARTAAGNHHQPGSSFDWQHVESSRGDQPFQMTREPLAPVLPPNTGPPADHWPFSQPTQPHLSQVTTEDHYGRPHFSSQSTQQGKRPRY